MKQRHLIKYRCLFLRSKQFERTKENDNNEITVIHFDNRFIYQSNSDYLGKRKTGKRNPYNYKNYERRTINKKGEKTCRKS